MKKLILLFLLLPSLLFAKTNPYVAGSTATTDTVVPTLISATIGTDGDTWTFVFSEAVKFGAGGNEGWVVEMSTAGSVTLTYSSGANTTTLVYTGDVTVNFGETVVDGLDYTQPGNGIEDIAANDLASIDSASVTNNSIQSESYADVLFYWGMETATAEKAGGDDSASYNSSAVLNDDIKAVGTKSLDSPSSYDYAYFGMADNVNLAEGRVGFYVYFTNRVLNGGLWRVYYNTSNYIHVAIHPTSTTALRLRYYVGGTGNALVTGNDVIWNDEWLFIEIAWKQSTDYHAIFVNGVEKASSTTNIGDTWDGTPTNMLIGDITGESGFDAHFDQLIISNDSTRDLYTIRNLTAFPD